MNGQQPNHAGMSGYGMTPQQQQAMMQQHQYSRMLNQQPQQQQPPQQQQQQQSLNQQTPMYNQNFYQQGYIVSHQNNSNLERITTTPKTLQQNIQIQAHGLLSNSHINNQQMMMPQQQQQPQQQQFYAAQQFQQQIPQDPLPQTQHHLQQQQQQQVQYNPQALYQQQQQPQQLHITLSQPQRRQTDSMHHLSQNPHQSAFSQPISQQSQLQQQPSRAIISQQQQQHVPSVILPQQQQQQHYYNPPPQQQQQRSEYSSIYEQQVHHPYSQQQQHPLPAAAAHRSISQQQQPPKPSMPSQIIQQPSPKVQQHVIIHHPKPTKPSPAKEAENSALHNEMIRKQRLAKEKQKLLEREKRETQKIQDELQTRQKQANLYAQDVQERLDQFKNPILFAGCHLTTNLTRILPFPRENVNPEDVPCHNPASCAEYLRREDPDLVGYMSSLLLNSFDDVKDLNVKHNEIEANIYDGNLLPPLMKNVHNLNQYSFHIQTEFDDITLDPELEKAVAEVVNSGELLHFDDNEDNLPSTSSSAAVITQRQANNTEEMAAKKSPPSKGPSKPVNTTGKEPKGKEKAFGSSRRKKNEVGELVDSLTPYYDVSGDRSRKRKLGSARLDSASDEENQPQPSTSDEPKFFNKSRKLKKVKREDEPERPPTPTEVIKQRELEWAEREKNLQDKNRLRQQQAEAEGLCVMAESESQQKVENLLEQVFDQFGGYDLYSADNGSSNNLLIDKSTLSQLRQEAQKLKNWRKLHKVDGDRLAKLVQLLEKNIRDVIDEEGQLICKDLLESDDIDNEVARNLLNERFIRASEAATLALVIMTSHRAPKQAMVEDTMERAAQLCKQMLAHVIYPAADTIVRNSKGKKSDEKPKKRKGVGNLSSSWVYVINHRVVDMIECFSELIRNFSLNEVTVALLSTMGTAPFFVDGIGQIQMASVQLLSVIFRKYDNFRHDIIRELLFSIHQLPPAKNLKNCYRLSSNENIHNFTVLILQLIQSVVIIPVKKRTEDGEDEKPTDEDDTFIESCFKEAKKWAITFLKSFLHKCTAKAEEDYRRKFETFLQDLLAALYRPDWPAAELMLTVLGTILVNTFRDKKLDISLRIASMDYLGTITARLRKDRVTTGKDNSFDKTRLEMVVKSILFDEANDSTALLDDVDISQLSSTEKMQKLQQALIDFLISAKSDNDVTAEYAIAFYAGEWYKKTVDDFEASQQQHQALQNENLSSSEIKKADKRYQRIVERSENMKEFLIKLADKKSLKKRGTHIAKSGRIMIDSDAAWTVRYLASKKEFSQSFNLYLKHILYEVQSDSPVTMRTKAIRCLSQIIESDSEVLDLTEVHNVVKQRMMDLNVAVREAIIELVGKYLIFRPDLFDNYYSVLCDRIMDTGVAVRKRVIRIFRDYIDKVPESPKVPEILSKIVRRVSDEEGVKKLALETLMTYWFTPVSDKPELEKKVYTLIDTLTFSLKDAKGEYIETFFISVLKKDDVDRNTMYAATQIVDRIVDAVLNFEKDLAEKESDLSNKEKIEVQKLNQNRLLSSLTTLSMLSKIRPELIVRHTDVFLPHLAKKPETQTELQVLNQVINMLERVIPLMEYPSETFLKQLDDRLCECIKKQGMLLIQSSIACLGAVCKRWRKIKSNISKTFIQYIGFLSKQKDTVLQNNIASDIPENVRGNLMRCIFSVGLMCRFFDFDKMLKENSVKQEPTSPEKPDEKRQIGIYAETIYSYLLFFSRSMDLEVSKKALSSLGHLCSEYPDFFERLELRNMYQTLLVSSDEKHLQMKVEVLKNLTLFLTVEEERMVKAREEYQRLRNTGELEDDLANSDTRGSINSAVIQVFWKHVLSSYIHQDSEVRIAVSQVVYQTMMQGLVTPGDPLPTMIAMTTDSIPSIRNKIEPLLKEIDQKYGGMLVTKAISGIRWTFETHRKLNTSNKNSHVFRGFRATEHCTDSVLDENGLPKTSSEAVAVLNALYACLRTNRTQRRSFLKNVIGMFSDDSREKPQLEEMLFIADNLATFAYQVSDEPLFIIHTADQIISLTGQNFLTNIKNLLLPKRVGELVDEEDEFTTENIYKRLPEDKTAIFALMKSSQACFLLLHIKTYLIKYYKLTEAKVKEYNPLESAKITDKPITRQQIPIFRPDNALQELRPEVIAQRETFDGQINLCEQIGFFRNMFYSLDIHADLEEDEKQPESSDETTNEPVAKRRRVISDEEDD